MYDPDDIVSLGDRLGGTLIEETATAYVVRLDSGGVTPLPKSPINTLLFGTDLVDGDRTVGVDNACQSRTLTFLGLADFTRTTAGSEFQFDQIPVTLQIDLGSGDVTLQIRDGSAVSLTGTHKQDAVETIIDAADDIDAADASDEYSIRTDTACTLFDVYERQLTDRVRPDVVEAVLDATPSVDNTQLDVTDDGVIVCDTFVVDWEARNYFVDGPTVVDITDGRSPQLDADTGSAQAIWLDMHPDGTTHTTVDGDDVFLSEREQEFLATVQILLQPDRNLDVNNWHTSVAGAIQKAKDGTTIPVVDELADSASVDAFVDPVSGLLHHHSVAKHTLTSSFGVKSWVVSEMHYTDWDHAGVWELAAMEHYLRTHDRDVFRDTDNNDNDRWETINETATQDNCAVTEAVRARIDSMW